MRYTTCCTIPRWRVVGWQLSSRLRPWPADGALLAGGVSRGAGSEGLRSSSRGRGRLAPRAAGDAVKRGARCGARLGCAGSRLATPRAESNLHPRVPTGPASPRSPPLVATLRQARGSIWTIVSAAGSEEGGV